MKTTLQGDADDDAKESGLIAIGAGANRNRRGPWLGPLPVPVGGARSVKTKNLPYDIGTVSLRLKAVRQP